MLAGVDSVVFFGLQYFVIEYLIKFFTENFFSREKSVVVSEYSRRIRTSLGADLPDYKHIEDLHDLGYLPLEIKALPEGSSVPIKVPFLTICNTKPEFFWLTNFIESLMSNILWKPITSATIAKEYRKILDKYAAETGMPPEFVQWQGHDFSFRGMSGLEAAILSGMGHLLSFTGTDTIPAIDALEEYYGANAEKELIGGSVPATEHSVMCSGSKEGELETFRRLITETYPKGIVSIVSDTWDLWKVCTEYLTQLKDVVMSRAGKVVIRPDSGNPVDILCGISIKDAHSIEDAGYILREKEGDETPHGEQGDSKPSDYFRIDGKIFKVTLDIDWGRYDKQYYFIDSYRIKSAEEVTLSPEQKGVVELLWDVFGGAINEKGHKVLDPHIGVIYGDSITLERAGDICRRLKDKGFASQVVFGIGSYTYQYNTRDTFGMAIKATYVTVDGEGREIQKDPVTDGGSKKSATGLLKVVKEDGKYVLVDKVSKEEEATGELRTIFYNGNVFARQSLKEIRERVKG
jgi:nicotinamide phosphoribosyltransferase